MRWRERLAGEGWREKGAKERWRERMAEEGWRDNPAGEIRQASLPPGLVAAAATSTCRLGWWRQGPPADAAA